MIYILLHKNVSFLLAHFALFENAILLYITKERIMNITNTWIYTMHIQTHKDNKNRRDLFYSLSRYNNNSSQQLLFPPFCMFFFTTKRFFYCSGFLLLSILFPSAFSPFLSLFEKKYLPKDSPSVSGVETSVIQSVRCLPIFTRPTTRRRHRSCYFFSYLRKYFTTFSKLPIFYYKFLFMF